MSNLLTSDKTSELLEALANFHKKVNPVTKDKVNPFFKSKYADFNTIWQTIQPILDECDLVVVQSGEPIVTDEAVRNYLTTIIFHVPSGQWIQGTFPLVVSKGDAQAMGSAITYMRRYSISSMLCLCTEQDDDGNAAVVGGSEAQQKTKGPITFDK